MNQPDLINVIQHLLTDKITNISIIGFIAENLVTEILQEGESVLIKGISDEEWIYIFSKDENELRTLLAQLSNKDIYFASVEDWMIPIINETKKFEWTLSTIRWYLPDDVDVTDNKFISNPISTEDIGFILSQSKYRQFLTVRYLKERITRSISACIYEDNKLVAWGLTHDDGALGSLNVLDEYRGKKYGTEIVLSLIHQCRALGKIPFAQIEETNHKAIKLVTKLGFVQDRRVTWIKSAQ
ncbi:MAG: GNAT family N-acetyltransferase [Ignavibacterium sp.]|nr:GNAT family N-acetyltransferase [Ignavibacterium sp.]